MHYLSELISSSKVHCVQFNTVQHVLSNIKGLSSREAARGHATNVDGEMLSVTINRIYNY